MRLKAVVFAFVSLLVVGTAALAQDYPTRPVRFITNTAPGGTLDILVRTIADQLSQQTGQQFYVDNKTGAGGNIAVAELARSPADGYTIGMATIATHGVNPTLFAKLPYDAVKDFTPISLAAVVPNILVVTPSLPAKNIPELVSYLRANPGKAFGSPGLGTGIHMAGELFKIAAGVDIVHLPYRGTALSLPDILSGRLELMFANPPDVVNLIREDKLRAVGISTKQRDPNFPEIPTIAEQGYPDFEVLTWFGVTGPAGLPNPVVERLNKEIGTALAKPNVVEHLQKLGMNVVSSRPQEFADYIQAEIKRWEPIVKASGVRIN
jgi:tripartite-type tricarboxylate transporter receptor subunit TctC